MKHVAAGQLGVRRARGSAAAAKPAHKPAATAKKKAAKPAAAAASEARPAQAAAGKPNRPPTAFESRVYAVCKCIPAGRVTTYGALAETLGSAPRACGQALRRNPFAPTVPCHRVIAASLELGGFNGSWGAACGSVQKKRALLAAEGVPFDEAGRLLKAAAVMSTAELQTAAAAVL